jgi:hypothetical protein
VSLCLIKQALCHEDIWWSGGIAPPFFTLALDGESSQLHTQAALPPGKDLLVPTGYKAAWAPVPIWMLRRTEESYPCQELNPTYPAPKPGATPTELSWLIIGIYQYFRGLYCLSLHSRTEHLYSKNWGRRFLQNTGRYLAHTPEDCHLHTHCCENLKSHRREHLQKHQNLENFELIRMHTVLTTECRMYRQTQNCTLDSLIQSNRRKEAREVII